MNRLYADMFILPVAGMLIAGCNPAGTATGYPAGYDLNEISFSRTVSYLAQDLYRKTGAIPKIHVIQTDNSFDVPYIVDTCNPSFGCDYEYSDQNPDIIVKIESVANMGVWSESQTTSGYYPVHTRLGFDTSTTPYSQNGWRQVELSNSWTADFPHLFPEDLAPGATESTRFAVTGHMRGFQFVHQNLFELVAANINTLNPEYTFLLGDFTRSSRGYEYDAVENHFIQKLDTTTQGNTVYLPGNHEVKNLRLFLENPYVDEFTFLNKEQEYAWPRPEFISAPTVNIIPINSANTQAAEIQQQINNVAIRPDYNATLPTVLLSHHKVWLNWHWSKDDIMPDFYPEDIMPMISGVDAMGDLQTPVVDVDVIIDGDGQDYIGRGVIFSWNFREYYSVGNGIKGEGAPIYFSIVSVGQTDQLLRTRPVYLDLPADHDYYTTVDYLCNESGCTSPPE